MTWARQKSLMHATNAARATLPAMPCCSTLSNSNGPCIVNE